MSLPDALRRREGAALAGGVGYAVVGDLGMRGEDA